MVQERVEVCVWGGLFFGSAVRSLTHSLQQQQQPSDEGAQRERYRERERDREGEGESGSGRARQSARESGGERELYPDVGLTRLRVACLSLPAASPPGSDAYRAAEQAPGLAARLGGAPQPRHTGPDGQAPAPLLLPCPPGGAQPRSALR